MRRPLPTLPLLLLLVGWSAAALSAQESNPVVETVSFVTTGAYSPNSTGVDYAPTDEARFSNTISYADFRLAVAAAHAAGTGGVVDFENPVFGDSRKDIDRTDVRAWVSDYIARNGVDTTIDRQVFFDQVRALAYAALEINARTELRAVPNRTDREFPVDGENALNTGQAFANVAALYGPGGARRLVIGRGPGYRQELAGAVATLGAPGPESRVTTNDGYFLSIGSQNSSLAAVSGLQYLSGGSNKHLQFDARDNVTTVGLTLLSFNNFQFWQGLGSAPANPDNARVVATFRNTLTGETVTSTYSGTTQQIAGRNQMFFGIRAPAGFAVDNLLCWVKGNNSRTFFNIDDLGFITAPARPYLSSPLTASGAAGRPFIYQIEAQQDPTNITVTGLPAGLTYNAAMRQIRGTPAATGAAAVTVTLTNAVGTTVETVNLAIGEATSATPLAITSAATGQATLGRDLTPYAVSTNATAEEAAALSYSARVNRVNDDGSRTATSLAFLGLALADGVVTGTPRRADQLGTYEVTFVATGPNGAAEHLWTLSIFPPVPRPNFDGGAGDLLTDFVFRAAGTVSVLLGQSFYDAGGLGQNNAALKTVVSGLAADAAVLVGDFDGDNNSDLVSYEPAAGRATLYTYNGTAFTGTAFGPVWPASPWRLLTVGDVDGAGRDALLFVDTRDQGLAVWRVSGPAILWSGHVLRDGLARTLRANADFDGDGKAEFLFQRGTSRTFEFFEVTELRTNGTVGTAGDVFTAPANWRLAAAADLNGDGKTDLLWEDTATGAVYGWVLASARVPADLRGGVDAAGTTAAPISPLVRVEDRLVEPGAALELLTSLTLNADNNADLLFQNRATKALQLVPMAGLANLPYAGTPEVMEDGLTPRPQPTRVAETGQIALQSARKTLQTRRYAPGQALALLADEALVDYTVYAQRTSEGAPVFTIDGFHARPAADTAAPVAAAGRNKSVWLDGYPAAGEALADYFVYQRDGDNPDGTPKPLRNRFGPVPKNVNQPTVVAGTQDNVWTPVAADVPGVDYVDYGRRGFLPQRDLFGNPRLTEGGEPLYVPFGSVADTVGNLPWELDYDVSLGFVEGFNAAQAPVVTGDYNADARSDLAAYEAAAGRLTIYAFDGRATVASATLTGLPANATLLSPRAFTVDLTAPTAARDGATVWLARRGLPATAAELAADRDGNGHSALADYAFGHGDLAPAARAPLALEADGAAAPLAAGTAPGTEPAGVLLSFTLRAGDPALRTLVEASGDLTAWTPATATVVSRVRLNAKFDRVTLRVQPPAGAGAAFLRLRLDYNP